MITVALNTAAFSTAAFSTAAFKKLPRTASKMLGSHRRLVHRLFVNWRLANWRLVLGAIALASLVACGGGDPAPTRGQVIGVAPTGVVYLKATIDAGSAVNQVQALTGAALCDVKVTSIKYKTVGAKNEETEAATALMLPTGTGAACSGARPILLYAHGTAVDKNYDMSSSSNGEAALVLAMYAAQGFIVVAPNYTGYSGSTLPYHPYLNAVAQSSDMIDGLRAAKASLASLGAGTTASAKLFISGYSQGGYVAMATHREIQTKYGNEFQVTGSAPLSGSYALAKFADVIFNGNINLGATLFAPLLVDSYQQAYGVYANASEVYQAPYNTTVPGLLPNVSATAAGALPNNLFNDLSGQPFLLTTAFRNDFLSNANNGLKKAAQTNDLLNWSPSSPVAMCYGARDQVVYGLNTTEAKTYFATKGLPVGLVTVHNMDDAATVPNSIKAGFDALNTQIATAAGGGAAGTAKVVERMHGTLAPFCNTLAREFFRAL